MNKLIALTICLSIQLSIFVQGQSIDPGSEWRVYFTKVEIGEDWYRVINDYKDFIDGDTILNSREYYQIYRSGYEDTIPISPRYQPIYHSYEHSRHGFLREENNKWYMYYGNQDLLIYDFTLDTGDTVESFFAFDCYNLTINETDSVNIGGDYKKRFHIFNGGAEIGYIIEGIGATTGLFEFFCTFEGGSYLVCYARNGVSLYGESTEDCDLAVTINEKPENKIPFSITPNPCKDFIILSIPGNFGNVKFTLINIFGEIIYQDLLESPSSCKIIVNDLFSGIYLAILDFNGQRKTTKLIIE